MTKEQEIILQKLKNNFLGKTINTTHSNETIKKMCDENKGKCVNITHAHNNAYVFYFNNGSIHTSITIDSISQVSETSVTGLVDGLGDSGTRTFTVI